VRQYSATTSVSIGTRSEEIQQLSPLLYLMDTGVFPIKRCKAQLGLGILVGASLFAVQSVVSAWKVLSRGWDIHEYISFLDSNRRWVNPDKIEIFSDRKVAGKIENELPG